MRRLALLLVPTLAVFGTTMPAAATPVVVHLDVDLALAAPLADCDVSVPAGSNGLAVLDAAVDVGCIDGYTLKPGQFAPYVQCIEKTVDLCETPDETLNAVTWIIYVDGSLTPANFGVSELFFPPHHSLELSYEPWAVHAPCWFFGICP